MTKTDSLLSHTQEATFEIAFQNAQKRIMNAPKVSDEDKQQLMKDLHHMTQGHLTRQLLIHKGLDAAMTQTVVLYPFLPTSSKKNFTPLEREILETFPVARATQERFQIFLKSLQNEVNTLMDSDMDPLHVASCPCGAMDDLFRLHYHGKHATLYGIDLDPQALQRARENEIKPPPEITINFLQKDAWDLDFQNQFHLLTSNGLNIYEKKEERVLELYKTFYKALKANGVFITSSLTPPPSLDSSSEWNRDAICPKASHRQKVVMSDLIEARWANYQPSQHTVSQLHEAGFCDVDIVWDHQRIFPTFIARK